MWHWRVRAKGKYTWGNWSTVRTFSVNTPPPAPSLVLPANESFHEGTPAAFTWIMPDDADSDLLHFILEIDRDGNFLTSVDHTYESWSHPTRFSRALPADCPLCTLSFTPPVSLNLAFGNWFWRVRAFDGNDFGAVSTVREFGVNTAPETPSLIYPVESSVFSGTPSRFEFSSPVDADGDALWFILQVDSDNDFERVDHTWQSWVSGAYFSPAQPQPQGTESATFNTPLTMILTPGTWHYRAAAFDGIHTGVFSDPVSFLVNAPPLAPSAVSPRSDVDTMETPKIFRFNIPSDADGDRLHFQVEFAREIFFASPSYAYDSRTDGAMFSPVVPVAEGSGQAEFNLGLSTLSSGDGSGASVLLTGLISGHFSPAQIQYKRKPACTFNHQSAAGACIQRCAAALSLYKTNDPKAIRSILLLSSQEPMILRLYRIHTTHRSHLIFLHPLFLLHPEMIQSHSHRLLRLTLAIVSGL